MRMICDRSSTGTVSHLCALGNVLLSWHIVKTIFNNSCTGTVFHLCALGNALLDAFANDF